MRKLLILLPFAVTAAAAAAVPRSVPVTAGRATVVIEDSAVRFTGEPITLSLKDADIKNVLRSFARLTGLNVVTDPAVGGTVTVELRNVPWDQALDVILRMHRLGWKLEGNVVYVAPLSLLATGAP